MNPELQQLVDEITSLDGGDAPTLMSGDSPVLDEAALEAGDSDGMYLIGLIGGKEVGKSALVNALVGKSITAQTAWGPGTQSVIAYCHEKQGRRLRDLLDDQVPGQYQIITHNVSALRRQVLLDLPDIDSHYAEHVEITRRMLRHMLYPIWMQSVEKYADQAPQELLAMVAEGNTPHNFLFCLNKMDQLVEREGISAVGEIRDDYADRLGRLLKLKEAAKVWTISAIHPEQFDLPALRCALSQQKTEDVVARSKHMAVRQQSLSVLNWIKQQNLAEKLDTLQRLEHDAEEQLASRVGEPLSERVVPHLLDNPALRLSQADELMAKRVQHWPIVNIVHLLLDPILSLLRRRLALTVQRGLEGSEELVETHLRALGAAGPAPMDEETLPFGGHSVAAAVQSTFAYLQQMHGEIGRLFAQRKLWETIPSEAAEIELRNKLAATLQRQREVMNARIATKPNGIGALGRWLVTVGAIIWFPLLQPLLEMSLRPLIEGGFHPITLLYRIVQLLGVTYLLTNATFLAIYFAVLWLALKWDTQRRVDRALDRWKAAENLDPSLSLTGQTMEWLAGLSEPIRAVRRRLESLLERSAALEKQLADEV